MKESIIITVVVALALVACARLDNYTNPVPSKENAVSFDVYIPRTVDTKAGDAGTITTDGTDGTSSEVVYTSLKSVGFGVFCTYSNGGDYDSSIGSNFMYNQNVAYGTSSWEYAPVKYWPNETIDDHNGGTAPANADKLSFFAYAPFVGDTDNKNLFTGSTDEGITGFTANTATTDPKIDYKVSTDPTKSVDLLWAVAGVSGVSYTDVHNASVSVAAGLPLINLTKPATNYTIPFLFKHATSRLAFTIQGAFDQVPAGGTQHAPTRITVEKVRVVNLPVSAAGKLNLNNTVANEPKWEEKSGTSTTLVVDGAKLNAKILDSGSGVQTVEGVTNTAKNLFVNDKTFFTLIPNAVNDGDPSTDDDVPTNVTIEITYYVTTEDVALEDGYSRIQNVITKTISFPTGFYAGKSYGIKIILGMTSVKLEASVEDWAEGFIAHADLPVNMLSVHVDANGDGETEAVYNAGDGNVTLEDVATGGATVSGFASKFAINTTNKSIELTGVEKGVYVITLSNDSGTKMSFSLVVIAPNSFDLVTNAPATIDGSGNAETEAVYTDAVGDIIIMDVTKSGETVIGFKEKFSVNTTNKSIKVKGVTQTGDYVLTVLAAGDEVTESATKTITLAVRVANDFSLNSTANATINASGNGETGAVFANAKGAVTIEGATKGGVDVTDFATKFSINTTNKSIVLTGVDATGDYVLTIKDAGNARYAVSTQNITLTVNNE